MRPLDDAQRADVERRMAEDRITGRGRRAALGVMFGAETGVIGAIVAVLTGGLWFVGAVLGAAVTGGLWLLLLAIPLRVRSRWMERVTRQRVAPSARPLPEIDVARSDRSFSIEGGRLHREPKKPYWPQ
ncbi:MAG: hypothetical protein JWO22_996 [Frankiales bacterium]|nr:hypothetical protein [Frankiales bacterium]